MKNGISMRNRSGSASDGAVGWSRAATFIGRGARSQDPVARKQYPANAGHWPLVPGDWSCRFPVRIHRQPLADFALEPGEDGGLVGLAENFLGDGLGAFTAPARAVL